MHAAVLQRLALIERLLARHESNDTIGRTISHGPSNRNDLIGPASLSKYGLNFLQFCPISSNLHLIVDSPKIVHAAARILFDQIPCPVPDCVLRSAQSDKLRSCLLFIIPVPTGDLRAGKEQLAGLIS